MNRLQLILFAVLNTVCFQLNAQLETVEDTIEVQNNAQIETQLENKEVDVTLLNQMIKDAETKDLKNTLNSSAVVKELKRENGQVYQIEFNSLGSKQIMTETDSDGNIKSKSDGLSEGLEETPNLPKWKIGSW